MDTLEELAKKAFAKQEFVNNLMMANTPHGFDDREKAFVQLAVARHEAHKAKVALDNAIANVEV